MHAYRRLLRLYPASFRDEYGAEMAAMFDRRRRRASGPLGRAALWLSTLAEIAGNAAIVHVDIVRQDIRYVARTLRRAPGFAITAVTIVALGIGATTAAFSVTDVVLLRPLPFPESDRLVQLWERHPGYREMDMAPGNFRDWKWASTSFENMGAYDGEEMNLFANGEPLRVTGVSVTPDVLPTLGIPPLVGRSFTEADAQPGAATVILGYQLWQSAFAGDAAIVGSAVLFDNTPFTVVGIMPRTFRFPGSDTTFWMPFRHGDSYWADRNNNTLHVVARLHPRATLAHARAELDVIAAQLARQYPRENADVGATVVPLADDVAGRSRLLLIALFGAAGCLLLIACANLANLLLARAVDRRRELAVRAAIGAGRERLVRQLMTESLLLAAIGGSCGVAIATVAVPLLARLVPASLPTAASPSVDARVLLFAVSLIALTGIAFGLAPVVGASRHTHVAGLGDGARSGGGRRERLRSTLVVAEIVASVVMLVAAGLLLRALWRLQTTDPGFTPDGVLTATTPLPQPQYAKVSTREAFYARVLGAVRALPGVTEAAYVSFVPMTFRGGVWPVTIAGRGVMRGERASLRYVTPGYFETLRIPLRRGRDVTASDDRGHPFVAVVSESFARRYWPNENPLGRTFNFAFADRQIVGVVGDVRVRGLEEPTDPQVYLSYAQVADGWITFYTPKDLVVRSAQPDAARTLAPAIRAIVRAIDPKLPVTNVRTMADIIDLETASRAVQVRVLGAFALIAFVLAAVGIHGLLSCVVSQRAQEIGVRMALGAQPRDIVTMMVDNAARLGAAGLVVGVGAAYAAARSMDALLAGIAPDDPATFGAAIALVAIMMVVGTLLPTIRALRIDPISAIRAE